MLLIFSALVGIHIYFIYAVYGQSPSIYSTYSELSTRSLCHAVYPNITISSIRINRMTTRYRWKFRTCNTTNNLTLYSFSSLYNFVTWGWPRVAETCRQPNETDPKTIVFWRTYPLLICTKHNGDDASKELWRNLSIHIQAPCYTNKISFACP